MKYGIKKGQKYDDNKEYKYLLIETSADLKTYIELDNFIKAKQSINLYFGFKSQNFRDDLGNYAVHEAGASNHMATIMPLALERFGIENHKSKFSLIDYCNVSDNMILSIHRNMAKYISEGKTVVINENGGYYYLLPDDEFKSLIDINELQLANFLLHKKLDLDFSIKSKILVLENARSIPYLLINKYQSLTDDNIEDIQIITDFKQRTLLFKDSDYFNFFKTGVENGLRTISFQTDGQDLRQLNGVRDILQTIAKSHKIKFKIYIRSFRLQENPSVLNHNPDLLDLNFIS